MKQAVEMLLGEGHEVEEALIDKNNGVRLDALVIRTPDMNIAPTIDLSIMKPAAKASKVSKFFFKIFN